MVWQHQKASLDANVSNLDEYTILMVIDFKENIKLPMELDQIGADFLNKEQCKIFNATVFVKNGGQVEKIYHDVISNILNHDSHFVQHYMQRIIEVSVHTADLFAHVTYRYTRCILCMNFAS